MLRNPVRRHLPLAALTLLACCLLLAGVATAAAGPSLSVSAGSAKATATRVKGSVTFHDAGPDGSGRFYFTLVVKLSGGNRLLKKVHEAGLAPSESKTTGFSAKLPSNLPVGRDPVWACAAKSRTAPEPSAKIGCRQLTAIDVPVARISPPSGVPTTPPSAIPPATPPISRPPAPAPSPPVSTVPTAPISFTAEEPFVENDANDGYYWADVPASYNPSNQTPTTLFVWLHGCGGKASGDIYTVSPEKVGTDEQPRDWISIAVGGRDEECWEPNSDSPLVLAAIESVETHFNIDRHRVILGGYSSGGDLAYRLAFYNADDFAGVLAENTAPFRDTGSTEAQSLAAAAYKFHVVHLAHLQDETYPIAQVRQETNAMIADGFPLERIEREGEHYNEEGDVVNGKPVPGTDADLINFLLPHIDDGWTSP